MFKLLVLQRLYNLSDEELEYQVNDRLSFMRFLGLRLEDSVPHATIVWLYREALTQRGLIKELFEQLDEYLQDQGYRAQGGQIVDATLIPVPKQHNSREENRQIKAGQTPAEWQESPNKLPQKDTNARWTKKNGISYYGFKNQISVDVKYGLGACHPLKEEEPEVLGHFWAELTVTQHDTMYFFFGMGKLKNTHGSLLVPHFRHN